MKVKMLVTHGATSWIRIKHINKLSPPKIRTLNHINFTDGKFLAQSLKHSSSASVEIFVDFRWRQDNLFKQPSIIDSY